MYSKKYAWIKHELKFHDRDVKLIAVCVLQQLVTHLDRRYNAIKPEGQCPLYCILQTLCPGDQLLVHILEKPC